MSQIESKTAPGCKRCGTCCRKGGPALHLEDKCLVESGDIPLKNLFTIRQGEPAYDNVAGSVSPSAGDIIKIKSRGEEDAACVYYDDSTGCSIYKNRPLECRVLACWNTAPIERVYRRNRLSREHLLSGTTELYELVTAHQQRCDYQRVRLLAEKIRNGNTIEKASQDLMEMVRYDLAIRQLVSERAGLSEHVCLFLFGRSLRRTVRLFGLRFAQKDGRIIVEC